MDSSPEELVVDTHSAAATQARAVALAPFLGAGSVLCLDGDLGAGKTAFVGGLLRALGGAGPVTSPTFTIENRYPVGIDGVCELVHADLYRLEGRAEEEILAGLLEARDAGAVLAVEWAASLKPWLKPYLELSITLLPADAPDHAPRRLALRAHPEPLDPASPLARAWLAAEDGVAP